jgi:hypothetical protein
MPAIDTIALYTAKSAERIIREGGTSSWRLDPNNARRCAYALCVRNAYSKWGDGTEPHHTGFLLGKISGVVQTFEDGHDDRYLIQFSEYAELNQPDAWPKGHRNPVRYTEIGELMLDPAGLDWKPMPEAVEAPTPEEPDAPTTGKTSGAMTIAEAKRGLALTFGVKPEAVEITIRG